jgi:hypothetical protein
MGDLRFTEERLEQVARRWPEPRVPAGLLARILDDVPGRRRARQRQRMAAAVGAIGTVVVAVSLLGGIGRADEPAGSVQVGSTPESFRAEANAVCRAAEAEATSVPPPTDGASIEEKLAHLERLRAIADREITSIGALTVPAESAPIVAAMLADAAESTRLFDEVLPGYVRSLETGEPLSAHDRAVAQDLDRVGARIDAAIVALGLDDCTGGASG